MLDSITRENKPLYKILPNVLNMELKLVIMSNKHEFNLIWDEKNQVNEEFFKMIDLEKGWVELRINHISAIIDKGKLKEEKIVRPQIRKLILEHYGQFE